MTGRPVRRARRGHGGSVYTVETELEIFCHLHMDSRLSDKRRRGSQDDGRLVTGQDDFMENTQKTPPKECGQFSMQDLSPKMGQAPGWGSAVYAHAVGRWTFC